MCFKLPPFSLPPVLSFHTCLLMPLSLSLPLSLYLSLSVSPPSNIYLSFPTCMSPTHSFSRGFLPLSISLSVSPPHPCQTSPIILYPPSTHLSLSPSLPPNIFIFLLSLPIYLSNFSPSCPNVPTLPECCYFSPCCSPPPPHPFLPVTSASICNRMSDRKGMSSLVY